MCHCHTNTVPPRMWEAWTGNSVVTELRAKSWHRSKPFSGANLKSHACAKLGTHVSIYFGAFYNSGITQTLFLERSAIMPF